MSLNNTGAGFNWTNEYLVSALPWATGSVATTTDPTRFTFPKITKYIKVRTTGQDHRVGFTSNGVTGSNYFTVDADTTQEFDVRVKQLFVMTESGAGTVDIFAGLTLIDERSMSVLTGSSVESNLPGAGWPGVG